MEAEIWTREQVAQYLRDDGTPEDKISDWYDDNRGEQTLHTAIFVGKYVRFMWISFRNLDEYRNETLEDSKRIARETKQDMFDLMNNPLSDQALDTSDVSPEFAGHLEALGKLLK